MGHGAFTASGMDLVKQSYPLQNLDAMLIYRLDSASVLPQRTTTGTNRAIESSPQHCHRTGMLKVALDGLSKAWRLVLSPCHTIGTPVSLSLRTQPRGPSFHIPVERLQQLDVLLFRSSREDQEAIDLLEKRTQRVDIEEVWR